MATHQTKLQSLALLVALVQQALPINVEAKGIGHELLLNRGAILQKEFQNGAANSDSVFERKSARELEFDDYDRYADLIKQWRISVVAPGRRLTTLMNTVSTRTISQLLARSGENSSDLAIDSVSRPMLKTFLSLSMVDAGQLQEWSKVRTVGDVGPACVSLLEFRDEEFVKAFGDKSQATQAEIFGIVEYLKKTDRLHLAYLAFKNNLNLFMLETYLHLCYRLDKVRASQDAFKTYRPLF